MGIDMNKGESLQAYKYRRMLEERRGNNFSYPSEKEWERLWKLGYNEMKPDISLNYVKEKVEELRESGHYARIVCRAQGKIFMREYIVIYRKKP